MHYLPKKACKQPAVLHNPQVEGPQNDRFQKVQLEGAIKKVPCSNIWTGRMSVNWFFRTKANKKHQDSCYSARHIF